MLYVVVVLYCIVLYCIVHYTTAGRHGENERAKEDTQHNENASKRAHSAFVPCFDPKLMNFVSERRKKSVSEFCSRNM